MINEILGLIIMSLGGCIVGWNTKHLAGILGLWIALMGMAIFIN